MSGEAIVVAMDLQAVEALNEDLTEFTRDIFKYLGYQGQRSYGQQYLRGLMLDGKRKAESGGADG
ncbi:MAG TPA: hypothetical protein VM347_23795 [Nonomuraea sp.]|nr:hypothetical protein [Nonomuraea sp.]